MPNPKPKLPGSRWRDERGYTLPELLVSLILLGMTMAVAGTLVIIAVQTQPELAERNSAVQRGRVFQERLGRDLRQSYLVETATPSQVSFETYARRVTCGSSQVLPPDQPAIACQVSYTCAAGACTRSEGPTDGSAAPRNERLVEGLSNSSTIFTFSPSASDVGYVKSKLIFPAGQGGEDAVTLEDGIDLRNR